MTCSKRKLKQNEGQMTETIVNNDKITICGYEVDTTVKSHRIHPDVIKGMRKVQAEQGSKRKAADYFNIHRNDFANILIRKTCSPAMYIKIINTLFTQKDAE